MISQDKPTFAIVMQTLAAAFDKEVAEDVLQAYWVALKDLPMDAFKGAAREALKTLEWMPKPAQLRKLSGEVGPNHRAAIAWQSVRKALGQHGTYTSVDFDDPVVNSTIRNLGGWVAFGQLSAKDFDVWTRKEFERIYAAIYETGVTRETGKYLKGIEEQANEGSYEVTPPVPVALGLPAPRVRMLLTEGDEVNDASRQIMAKAFSNRVLAK